MEVILSPLAAKALRRMPKPDAARLLAKLGTVAEAPAARHPWAVQLKGSDSAPTFRIRQGVWRAVYRIDDATQELVVDRIAHHREVYR